MEIAALDERCVWHRVQAKKWLLHQNDIRTDTYFLTSGVARVIINTSCGNEVILADMKAGDYFGEMPAIDSQPQSAGVLAITDATFASMPAVVFRQVLHKHPDVIERVLRDFCSRMRTLHQRVQELHSMPVRHRIYAELVRRSRTDPTDRRQTVVSPPPQHAELAARVGTRRETVGRELKALERAGFFTRREGAFVITNGEPQKLAQIRNS
jgi:CRP/FNR family cyclic AMP-dependent transcriptional regulator